jgi:hypothetical protein
MLIPEPELKTPSSWSQPGRYSDNGCEIAISHVIPDERPVRFRSQVGVLTTAYRGGPEVCFGKSLGRVVAMSSKCRGKISPHKSASVYKRVRSCRYAASLDA